MVECFVQTFIGLGQIDIFSDNGDIDRFLQHLDFVNQLLPSLEPGCSGPDIEQFDNFVIQPFLVKYQWNFVNAVYIFGGDDRIYTDITKQGDLGINIPGQILICTAK